MGGIRLNFPYPAKDSYSGLDITTPGCQLLNGAEALAVARARHYEYYANGYWQYDGTSDFGRIQRQDVFLRSLITAAKSKVNPLTVNAFIGSVHEGVTIDDGFGFNELIGLALTYHSFDPTNLQAQTLPTEAANGFGDLGDVLTAQQPEAQQMLVNIFGSSLETPTNPPPDAAGNPTRHRPSPRRRWRRPARILRCRPRLPLRRLCPRRRSTRRPADERSPVTMPSPANRIRQRRPARCRRHIDEAAGSFPLSGRPPERDRTNEENDLLDGRSSRFQSSNSAVMAGIASKLAGQVVTTSGDAATADANLRIAAVSAR